MRSSGDCPEAANRNDRLQPQSHHIAREILFVGSSDLLTAPEQMGNIAIPENGSWPFRTPDPEKSLAIWKDCKRTVAGVQCKDGSHSERAWTAKGTDRTGWMTAARNVKGVQELVRVVLRRGIDDGGCRRFRRLTCRWFAVRFCRRWRWRHLQGLGRGQPDGLAAVGLLRLRAMHGSAAFVAHLVEAAQQELAEAPGQLDLAEHWPDARSCARWRDGRDPGRQLVLIAAVRGQAAGDGCLRVGIARGLGVAALDEAVSGLEDPGIGVGEVTCALSGGCGDGPSLPDLGQTPLPVSHPCRRLVAAAAGLRQWRHHHRRVPGWLPPRRLPAIREDRRQVQRLARRMARRQEIVKPRQ